MESERRKFFKKKINFVASENSKQKTKGDQNEQYSKSERVKHGKYKATNSANREVTVLGSCSYFNQNQDLRILKSPNDTEKNTEGDNEKDLDEENNHEQEIQQCDAESTNNIIQEQTEQTIAINNKDTSIRNEEKILNIELKKEYHNNNEKIIKDDGESGLVHDQFIIEIEVEENLSKDDKTSSLKENNQNKEGRIQTNDNKNIQEQNKLHNSRTTEEDTAVHAEKTVDLCYDTTLQNNNECERDWETCGILEERSFDRKEKEYETSDLQPTITEMITETDMNLMRKSLENDNPVEDIYIPSFPEEETVPDNKKRKKALINHSYVDFLSEDEDFEWDSTSWKETGASSSSEDDQPPRKKKMKKRLQEEKVGNDGLKKKKINKKRKRKEHRISGKQYVKKSGLVSREKMLHPNPCANKNCGHKCGEVDEIKRKSLFDHYWSLSAERKKDWIVAMSAKKEIKRKRNKGSSYRENTFEYFINDGEGRRQVCLQFLLKTLDITQRYVYYTLSNANMGSAKSDERGKIVPSNKTPEEVKNSAMNFLKSLPALPSHYCRKESTRLYLPTEFKNIKNLYRIYKQDRVSKGVDVVSERVFREIFNKDFNLGFHVPKKDKCVKCLKHEGKDKSDPEIKIHLEEKEASKKRLECHRELHKKNPSILCTSFDLQKVLNTPHGNSMLLFYSRKYAVYNLCFYESITRNGFCYVWGETEGKRGGNEIASILQKYIEDVDQRESIKSLIMYSDSCPGQNKNKIVLAAIHNALLLSKNLETIQMNYLLPGHTEMTVDSIHSTIESSIRNTTVWAPSQWITVCQLARKEPGPYQVENLNHEDFKNFDDLSDKYFKGNLAGKITKIRIATFKKSTPNVMTVKYSMKNDATEESIPIISKPKALTAKYKSSLPITKTKYNDLKRLCDTSVIPRIFHAEYLNFPTCNGKDVLIDTDIEDDVND